MIVVVVLFFFAMIFAVFARDAQAVVPNPDLAVGGCVKNIAIVFHRYGPPNVAAALASTGMPIRRGEVKALVDSFEGTDSTLSITSFAETGTVEAPPTNTDAAGMAALREAVDGIAIEEGPIAAAGKSNWEAGFATSQSTFDGFPEDRPDLLIFFANNPPNADSGLGNPALAAELAADQIKLAGTHVFGFEVDRVHTPQPPYGAVFGPDVWQANVPFSQADYVPRDPVAMESLFTAGLKRMCGGEDPIEPLNVTAATNPDLETTCGLDMAIIVDRTGSIGAANIGTVRNAINELIDELVGTRSRISLVSYADWATLDAPVTPVTPGPGLDQLHEAVNGLESVGNTSWLHGHLVAKRAFDGFAPANRPDLVLHITDGNPNVPRSVTFALPFAVQAVNDIKAIGAHVMAVGVGGPSVLNVDNIKAVSGPDAFPATPVDQADYVVVDQFDQLQDALLDSVGNLCPASVAVQKLVNGEPAKDWSFQATGSVTADALKTDDEGLTIFGYDLGAGDPAVTTTITEVAQDGFELDEVSCHTGDGSTIGTPAGEDGITLPVGPEERLKCVFKNVTSAEPIDGEPPGDDTDVGSQESGGGDEEPGTEAGDPAVGNSGDDPDPDAEPGSAGLPRTGANILLMISSALWFTSAGLATTATVRRRRRSSSAVRRLPA